MVKYFSGLSGLLAFVVVTHVQSHGQQCQPGNFLNFLQPVLHYGNDKHKNAIQSDRSFIRNTRQIYGNDQYRNLYAYSHILKLTDSNFDDQLSVHKILFVMFYAPWCYWSKQLLPNFEKAATILKLSNPDIVLGKINCDIETDTCENVYGIEGYPTLKLFKNGHLLANYNGPRETDKIVEHLRQHAYHTKQQTTTYQPWYQPWLITKTSVHVTKMAIGNLKLDDKISLETSTTRPTEIIVSKFEHSDGQQAHPLFKPGQQDQPRFKAVHDDQPQFSTAISFKDSCMTLFLILLLLMISNFLNNS